MKKLHIIFYVCMVVLFFGCSRDESDLNDKKLEPISFNSVISEDILTRATGTRWDKGDQIGIFCFKGGETLSDVSILNNYTNIPFYTNGNSTFYADGQKLYYPSNSSSVSFISYYPYKPNLANYEYPIDIEKQEDFLYSNNLNSVVNDNMSKTLYFRRALSKIVFNVSPKNTGNLEGVSVTLKNVNTKATFSLVNGTMSVDESFTSSVPLNIKEGNLANNKVVNALLLPTEQANSITVEFKSADNKTYTWKIPHKLERGKVYTYNIKLDGLSTEITRPKDYMEIPYFTASASAPHSYRVLHMVKDISWLNPSYQRRKIRNYSILFDTKHHLPYWVAYPMHPVYFTSGNRTNKWQYDPVVPREYQPNLRRGYREGRTYARGHMMASADRSATRELNKTTFYYTNMVPQNHKMNGGRWGDLEGRVRHWCRQTAQYDTLYVVTGAILPKSPDAIKYATDRDGKKSAIPKYMYKALLRKEKSTGKYYSIGFKMENTAHGDNYKNSVISVEELEKETGFTFFPNVPNGKQVKKQKDMVHWN